jgi:hypothetical protein
MRTRRLRGALGLALALQTGACGFHAYSPPAGWSRASHVATAAPGEALLGAAVHGGGGVFGPELAGGELSFRRGLSQLVEFDGDAGWIQITEQPRRPVFRGIMTGRIGVRGRFARDLPHLAWLASVGGGGHVGGGFLAPEVGLQAGWENPWMTPWVRASAFLSQPLGARPVDLAGEGDAGPRVETPLATVGLRLGAGLSLRWVDFPVRLHLAVHMVHLARFDGPTDRVSHAGLGLEYRLGP